MRRAGVLAFSALVGLAAASPATGAARPVLIASLGAGELTYGAPLTVTGSLTDGASGMGVVPLALQADPYPFRGFLTIAHGSTAPDGSFAFAGVNLDRNTRLQVVSEGTQPTTSSQLSVTVDPNARSSAHSLGPGRTRLSVRVRHATLGGTVQAVARWYLAARGSRVFRLAAVTHTRELSRGLTYASAIVDPPSKRFVYRVCFNPPWEHAMGPAASHGPCPEHDFKLPGHAG
jgi:hypothetical protein